MTNDRRNPAWPVSGPDWPEVSDLLDTALDLAPAARAAWLDALQPPAARHRGALERLLADHAVVETGDFLQRGALARPPLRLAGPYRLLRELGRGGMATVWLAERADGLLQRPVALKLPHPGLATHAFAERLARERDILAALAHPNIARLYDAGVGADGQPYIALEYVQGQPVDTFCDGARLGPRRRVQLFEQVLDAVQYAHTQLVIHRDLKPSNVLVDAEGRVHLLDFGIAKLMVDGRGEATELTFEQGAAMTPDFASPEQIAGGVLGTASDVYSLGVLLFVLLAGHRPYRLPRLPQAALAEALRAVDVPRPSGVVDDGAAAARGLGRRALQRALRGDLDNIVLKALRADPAQRYGTAAELRADLQRWRRGEPVLARPARFGYRARKFVGRHRWAFAGGVAAAAAVSAAAVGYALQAREAIAERDHARAMADRSDATARFLNDLLVEAGQSERPIALSDLLERSEQLVAAGYADNPDHRAAVLDTLANYYVTVGQQAKGAGLMAQAVAAAASSPDPALQDQLRCNQAFAISKLGRVDEALAMLRSTLGHEFRDPRVRVVCTLYLSFIGHDTHDAAASLRFAQEAVAQLQALPSPLPELQAELQGNLGTAWQDNGRTAEAEEAFARALRLYRGLGRDRGQVAMTVRNNWSSVLADAGSPREALALLDEMLAIFEARDPQSRPPIYLLANRAHMLRYLGRYDEAAPAYGLFLDAARAQDSPPFEVSARVGLAALARERGDLAGAGREMALAQQVFDSHQPAAAGAANRLRFEGALLELARGHAEAARQALEALLARPAPPAAQVSTLAALAQAERALGRVAAALDHARRAATLGESLQGAHPYSNRTGVAWLETGLALAAGGDDAAAALAYSKAAQHLAHTVEPGQAQRVQLQALLR